MSIDMNKYKKMDVISIVINGEENNGVITSEQIKENGKITIDMIVEDTETTNEGVVLEDEK